jgi:Dna[CI] antecedent, DciA
MSGPPDRAGQPGPMPDPDRPGRTRRRPMERIGDLIPEAARRLGLEDELRLARAGATWDALVAERVPPAAGACRLVRAEPGGGLLIEADEPIVGQELRLRSAELLAAFRAAPGGFGARDLRVVVRRV